MDCELENRIRLLECTPAALDALLRGLPEAWTETNEGGNSWSASTVIAHLTQGEQEDWMPRIRHILQFGETRPFEPFDREAHVRYGKGKTMTQLLDEFAKARARSLDELHALKLTHQDLERRGLHPALGSVALSELLATWAAHDLTHLHQISRIMAHGARSRGTVGAVPGRNAVRGPQRSSLKCVSPALPCRHARSGVVRHI